MSLDLNVFVKEIDDSIIPRWMERMNQFDMECEIHPNFSFKDHSGFLPFKIKLKNTQNESLKDKELLSGFELYIEEFDYKSEIESMQPERTFFQKLFNKPIEKVELVNAEIDTKLKECKVVLNFNWGSSGNTLELRMASLASAIIAELTNGLCCYASDDIWYDNKTIVQDAFDESLAYEQSLKPNEWKIHEFKSW